MLIIFLKAGVYKTTHDNPPFSPIYEVIWEGEVIDKYAELADAHNALYEKLRSEQMHHGPDAVVGNMLIEHKTAVDRRPDMAEAHAEGWHDDFPRDGCPDCD